MSKSENLDRVLIHQAFSPAKEIADPELFVGRYNEIKDGISALMNPGGFTVIYGLRGVGKSSIAYQLKLIAEGNLVLPNLLKLKNELPKRGFNFITHYIKCDKYVKNIKDLLIRILHGDDQNSSLFSLTSSGNKKLEQFKKVVQIKGGANIGVAEIGAKGAEEKIYSHQVSDDIIQQFRQLLGTIQKDNNKKSGLLILIDEFDIIQDKTGFGSIVKACSSDFVKFGIVGIASNIAELITDHSSISRQVNMILVNRMPKTELSQILHKAERKVDNKIQFNTDAIEEITKCSEGFPFFTHLLGKEAMLIALGRYSNEITKEDMNGLHEKISEGRLQTIYENHYHAAVKNSTQREILLKLFSEEKADEISTEPIYASAKEFGISNPSQLMKELTSTSEILTKVRDRYYRFSDPVFKVYSRIRNWKY